MGSKATPRIETASQYHHFIPRFILRNFAHPFQPANVSRRQSKQRKKSQREKGCYPGDPMLYTINLAGSEPVIEESPVSRTFGKTDMYRDLANAPNQHEIEQKLSRLESNAAQVIQKIRKEHEAQKKEIWISRSEKDTLRKFLFIMKYRGSRFQQRFYHQRPEEYSEDDTEQLRNYMHKKGYKRPVDVWFDNIKALVDLKMDPEMKWVAELLDKMYPDDAMWAFTNIQHMYLALCTPSNQEDEFLLTENAYSIHEGPVSCITEVETGDVREPYTEFHVFAVISPKLIMVLRSLLLPVPEEDCDPSIKEARERMYALNASQHADPSRANSCLQDLPIRKARNSYTNVVGGRLHHVDGKDGGLRLDDKFCFQFFPITTLHVNKINAIMLEESYSISTIAFKSKSSARKTLEFYLTVPVINVNQYGMKIFAMGDDDPKLVCLKKLQQAVRQLGSDVTAVYQVQNIEKEEDESFEQLGELLENNLPKEPSGTMKLYMKLGKLGIHRLGTELNRLFPGGSARRFPKDMDQTRRMVKLRIKIDVWSKGTDESIRQEIRDNLRDLFSQLPPRRLWNYLKYIRYMELNTGFKDNRPDSILDRCELRDVMDGPEDVIASMCQLFRAEDLGRVMHFATLNDVFLTKHPDFNLKAEITFDEKGARCLYITKKLTFDSAGSICNCGIPEVENKARAHMQVAQGLGVLGLSIKNPFWSQEEMAEMTVRALVRSELPAILRKRISASDLKPLDEVLFDIIYPTIAS